MVNAGRGGVVERAVGGEVEMRAESGRERRPRRDARVGEFLVGQAELGEERSAADVRADGVEVVGRCRGRRARGGRHGDDSAGCRGCEAGSAGGVREARRERARRAGVTRGSETCVRHDATSDAHCTRRALCPEVASARGASTTGHVQIVGTLVTRLASLDCHLKSKRRESLTARVATAARAPRVSTFFAFGARADIPRTPWRPR